MKMYRKIPAVTAIVVTFLMAAGCATTGKSLTQANKVEIEKVSSQWAGFRFVNVVQDGDKIELRGEVYRRSIGWGAMPSHVGLEVIGPDGAILEKGIVNYHRRSLKSSYGTFKTKLKTVPAGSIIRLTADNNTVFSCEQGDCE